MDSPIINTITDFLAFAGIGFVIRRINIPTFLPGLQLENGKIIIDTEKLPYPGDIRHEAGHLAAYNTGVRETISDP